MAVRCGLKQNRLRRPPHNEGFSMGVALQYGVVMGVASLLDVSWGLQRVHLGVPRRLVNVKQHTDGWLSVFTCRLYPRMCLGSCVWNTMYRITFFSSMRMLPFFGVVCLVNFVVNPPELSMVFRNIVRFRFSLVSTQPFSPSLCLATMSAAVVCRQLFRFVVGTKGVFVICSFSPANFFAVLLCFLSCSSRPISLAHKHH